jgi:hypothetical protein
MEEEAFSAVQPGIGRYLPRRTSVVGLGRLIIGRYFVFSVVLPMNGFTFGLPMVSGHDIVHNFGLVG